MISDYSIGMIYAQDEEGGIGLMGRIPWFHRGDSDHFWNTIGDMPVIVGTNTFKHAEKYFLKRRGLFPNTMIMSRRCSYHITQNPVNPEFFCANVRNTTDIVNTMDKLVADTNGRIGTGIWICGGAQIYQALLPYADIFVETNICGTLGCDTFMPWKTSTPVNAREVGTFLLDTYHSDVLTAIGKVYAKKSLTDAEVRHHASNLNCLQLLGVSEWR